MVAIRRRGFGRTLGPALFVGLVVGFGGCSSREIGGGGRSTAVGERKPPQDAITCGATCSTDVAAARTLLVAGKFQEAYDEYRCADTPEAAFGAGLTHSLLALEGEGATKLLADIGLPRFPARDLAGPDGYLARSAAMWRGGGTLQLSGGLSGSIAFDRGRLTSENGLELEGRASPEHARFDAYPVIDPGEHRLTFDCATGARAGSDEALSGLYFDWEGADGYHDCNVAVTTDTATCSPDGGSLTISPVPAAGGTATATLDALLFRCYAESTGDSTMVRVSGALEATVSTSEIDTSDLHPIFSDVSLRAKDMDATEALGHAHDLGAEFNLSACYFAKAGQGSGTVFTLPGALYGGTDLPVTAADAELLSAAAATVAGFGELLVTYSLDMPLADVVCALTEDLGDTGCPTREEFADSFNAAFGKELDGAAYGTAAGLVEFALARANAGLAGLDDASLAPRNARSAAGIDALTDVGGALRASLSRGPTALPGISPALRVDLDGLFSRVPAPRSTDGVLRYAETCEGGECWDSLDLDTDALSELLSSLDADFDGNYDWAADSDVSDALDELGNHLSSASVLPE